MIHTTTRQDERQKSRTTVRPFSSAIEIGSVRLLHPGAVLIRAGAEFPELSCPRRRIAGWNLMDGLNAYDLHVLLRKKGWYFSFFVPKERKRNCLGMKYVKVTVHPHHARRNPYARDLDQDKRVEGMWDFKRIHHATSRQVKHVKAI